MGQGGRGTLQVQIFGGGWGGGGRGGAEGGRGGVPSRSKFSGGGRVPSRSNFFGGGGGAGWGGDTLKVQIFFGGGRGTLPSRSKFSGGAGGVPGTLKVEIFGGGRAGRGGVPSRSKFSGGGTPPPSPPPVDRQSENITFVILRMAGGKNVVQCLFM